MEHKSTELEGARLNAAVARAEGLPAHPGPGRFIVAASLDAPWAHEFDFLSWQDAGPIVERERITIVCDKYGKGEWKAWVGPVTITDLDDTSHACGATPLIAAMRAYVAHKLGATVDLP